MNKQEQIPTAEDFIANIDPDIFAVGAVFSESGYSMKVLKEALINFTKIHVKAALEKAAEKAVAKEDPDDYGTGSIWVDKDSILKAYPEENIR